MSAQHWWQWPALIVCTLAALHDGAVLVCKAWFAPKREIRDIGQTVFWSALWGTLAVAVAVSMVPT